MRTYWSKNEQTKLRTTCINMDVYLKKLAMLGNIKQKSGQLNEYSLIKVACT